MSTIKLEPEHVEQGKAGRIQVPNGPENRLSGRFAWDRGRKRRSLGRHWDQTVLHTRKFGQQVSCERPYQVFCYPRPGTFAWLQVQRRYLSLDPLVKEVTFDLFNLPWFQAVSAQEGPIIWMSLQQLVGAPGHHLGQFGMCRIILGHRELFIKVFQLGRGDRRQPQ